MFSIVVLLIAAYLVKLNIGRAGHMADRKTFEVIDGGLSTPTPGDDPATEFAGEPDSRQRRQRGGGAGDPNKLTAKQEAFAINVALQGMNQTDAYREAYETTTSNMNTVYSRASVLASNEKVKKRIAQLKGKTEQVALQNAASLRAFIEKGLYDLATSGEAESTKLRAMELLGKSEKVGFFLERSSDIPGEELSPEELQERIRERLRQAFAQ